MMSTTTSARYETDDQRFWYYSGSAVPPVETSQGQIYVYSKFVTKEDTHWDYRNLIARGLNATSVLQARDWQYTTRSHFENYEDFERPFDPPSAKYLAPEERMDVYRHFVGFNTRYHDYIRGRFRTSGLDGYYNSNATSLTSKVDSRALEIFSKKAISAQRKFQSLVFGGELKETIELLVRPARAVRGLLDGHVGSFLKKGAPRRFHNGSSLRRYVSDRWLEFSFGVKPLLSDLEDAGNAIVDTLIRTDPNVKVTAKYRDQIVNVTPVSDETFGNARIRRRYVESRFGAYVKYFGSIHCPTWSGDHKFPFDSLGLDWSEVLPSFWELIPYSFLVDYFTNVGTIIDAFSHGRSNVLWITRTEIKVYENSYSQDFSLEPNYDIQTAVDSVTRVYGHRVFHLRRSVNRATYNGTIIPNLSFSVPGISTKWLNIAALIGASGRVHSTLRRGIIR